MNKQTFGIELFAMFIMVHIAGIYFLINDDGTRPNRQSVEVVETIEMEELVISVNDSVEIDMEGIEIVASR